MDTKSEIADLLRNIDLNEVAERLVAAAKAAKTREEADAVWTTVDELMDDLKADVAIRGAKILVERGFGATPRSQSVLVKFHDYLFPKS